MLFQDAKITMLSSDWSLRNIFFKLPFFFRMRQNVAFGATNGDVLGHINQIEALGWNQVSGCPFLTRYDAWETSYQALRGQVNN